MMEAEAARCQAPRDFPRTLALYLGSMRRINPGPWQTSIGQHPAGKMIRDVGGILRQGLREPEQDKAHPVLANVPIKSTR
jgi:hypothetical protein